MIGDDLEGRHRFLADIELHHALVEFAFAQLLAELFPGAGARLSSQQRFLLEAESDGLVVVRGRFGRNLRRHRGQQQIEQALLGIELRLVGNVFQLFFAHHVDGDFDQVADHRFHVAPDVADLGELRSLNLHERRVRELGQTACDLRLPHAGGADHDDVLGDDFFRQLGRQLLAAHAIAQGDGDGALGVVLSDDILVEFAHDFARS